MVVPPYCRSRQGRVFRVQRISQPVGPDRIRYILRATPLQANAVPSSVEASREIDALEVRDKIRHGLAIPSPEQTFEQLWQQLRLELDAQDS